MSASNVASAGPGPEAAGRVLIDASNDGVPQQLTDSLLQALLPSLTR